MPFGPDLIVPVRPREGFGSPVATDSPERSDGFFVRALVNLKDAAQSLRGYAAEIRAAADEQIAQARANGVDLTLIGVGFKPASVYQPLDH